MKIEIIEKALSLAAALAAILSALLMCVQLLQASPSVPAASQDAIQPCVVER